MGTIQMFSFFLVFNTLAGSSNMFLVYYSLSKIDGSSLRPIPYFRITLLIA